MKDSTRTMVALLISMLTTYATTALVPFFFETLETELDAGPTKLGLLVMLNRITNSIAGVAWGWSADSYPRIRLWVLSSAMGALPTFVLAFAVNYTMFLLVYASAALGWSGLRSIALSLLPDLFVPTWRGKAMAIVGIYILAATVTAVILSSMFQSQIGGVDGWRILHAVLALAQIPACMAVMKLAVDPPRGGKDGGDVVVDEETLPYVEEVEEIEQQEEQEPEPDRDRGGRDDGRYTGVAPDVVPDREEGEERVGLAGRISMAKEALIPIITNRAFTLFTMSITMQSLPTAALAFAVLWFRYSGLSETGAAAAYAFAAMGFVIGSGIGGTAGDWISTRARNHGRILIAQVCVVCNTTLILILILVMEKDNLFAIAPVMLLIGVFISIPPFACDLPCSARIVRFHERGLAYALQGMVSGVVASTGSLLTGAIAENWFGYVERDQDIEDVPPGIRAKNRDALSHACLVVFMFCYITQFFLYFIIYKVYPAARDAAQAHAKPTAHSDDRGDGTYDDHDRDETVSSVSDDGAESQDDDDDRSDASLSSEYVSSDQ